jgi:hypothetical protein
MTTVSEIGIMGEESAPNVKVVGVREALYLQIGLVILNAALLKKICPEILKEAALMMTDLREVSIGIVEVVRGSLSGKDIKEEKLESHLGSKLEIW